MLHTGPFFLKLFERKFLILYFIPFDEVCGLQRTCLDAKSDFDTPTSMQTFSVNIYTYIYLIAFRHI